MPRTRPASDPHGAIRNEAPRAKALRVLRQWVRDGELAPGEAIPSERDLARRLDVALATVQRALRVLEAEGVITKHAGGRTRTVKESASNQSGVLANTMLLLADSADLKRLSGAPAFGWAGYVARGAFDELSGATAHTMVLSGQSITLAAFERLLHGRPMGVVIPDVAALGLDVLGCARLSAIQGVPCVVYGDEEGYTAFDRVVPDHETGAYELTGWLLSRGRREIHTFWTGALNSAWSKARYAGYVRAMRGAGLEPRAPIVSPVASFDGLSSPDARTSRAQAVAGALLPHLFPKPSMDALMVVSDGEVASVQAALELFGKALNRDIEIVGYDNYWEQAPTREWNAAGPLATVDKDNIGAGRELVRLLLQRVRGELPAEPQLRLIAPSLRVRIP